MGCVNGKPILGKEDLEFIATYTGECTMLQKLSKCEVKALIILPPFRFYVKSNLGKFKRSKNVIVGNFGGSEFSL